MAKEDKEKKQELDADRIMKYVIGKFPFAVRTALKNGNSQTDLVMHILETTAPTNNTVRGSWEGNITNMDFSTQDSQR